MASLAPVNTDDKYILKRDFYAALRLNCQHWLWRQQLGYNLHPSITVPSNAYIADVATGTGAWLLEVAREQSNAQCDGFDISIEQAPPLAWLPFNVSLREWDIYKPPPEELIGKYDIVHVRLVALAVRNNDAMTVFQHLSLLLKPGGWLQWDEVDATDTVIMHAAGEGGKTDAVKKMDALMKEHGSNEWIMKLPSTMRETGGFAEAKVHRVEQEKSFLKFQNDNILGSWMEIVSNQAEGSEQKKQYEQFALALQEEMTQGAAHGMTKVINVGRKAA